MASTPDIKVQEAPKTEAPLVNQSGYFDKLRQQKQKKGFLSTFLSDAKLAESLKSTVPSTPNSNNPAQRLSEYLGSSNTQKVAK
jgi:hypothetical protein